MLRFYLFRSALLMVCRVGLIEMLSPSACLVPGHPIPLPAPYPPPPKKKKKKHLIGFFVKIHLLESFKLALYDFDLHFTSYSLMIIFGENPDCFVLYGVLMVSRMVLVEILYLWAYPVPAHPMRPTPTPPPEKHFPWIWDCCQNSLTRDLKIEVIRLIL